jgi:phenylacetate-CoA ligase
MASANRIIDKSPTFVKNLYYRIIPFRKRYGIQFSKTFDFLLDSIEWDQTRMLEYQFDQLKGIISHAFNETNYYHRLFIDYGINPNITSFDDIKRIPFLTKELINENFNDLISNNYNGKKVIFKTSGSTGKKFQFVGSDDMYKKEAAFVLRSFYLHNSSMYDVPTVWIRRYAPEKGDPIFNWDRELNRMYISPFDISINTIEQYVRIINNTKAKTIVTYPSLANFLATLMREKNLLFDKIEYIHCASEMVMPEWRINVFKSIGIPLKSHYGMMEKVSFFCNTAESDKYLENLEYGFTEIIDGELVGTGFMNKVMPFIRYLPGDQAMLNYNLTYHKSLPFSVDDFIGRSTDMINTIDGRKLSGVNFYTMMYKIEGVEMFQIIQKTLNFFVVNIIKNLKYDDNTDLQIIKGIKDRVGDCSIEIVYVPTLERSNSGKLKTIINECKSE